jgi:hypothetical protein
MIAAASVPTFVLSPNELHQHSPASGRFRDLGILDLETLAIATLPRGKNLRVAEGEWADICERSGEWPLIG